MTRPGKIPNESGEMAITHERVFLTTKNTVVFLAFGVGGGGWGGRLFD